MANQSSGQNAPAAPPLFPSCAIVHPLVLLSATDHYMRVAKDTNKRVVGVLLGAREIAGERDSWRLSTHENQFALPFEEDENNPGIWFLDHNYLENMFGMFKKVNAREKIVGWYSTGPKIRASDLEINEVFKKYTKNPVLVIINVQPKDELDIPTDAYISIEEVKDDGTPTRRSFQHLQSEIGAEEAEEIGVEHLLRDIKDASVSTLAERVHSKLNSLKGLKARLEDIHAYLKLVADGSMPVNHEITYLMQEVFNLLPNLNVEELVSRHDFDLQVIYISSLIRSVLALHNLINNKIALKDAENESADDAAGKEKNEKDKNSKESSEEKDKVK
ncbi:26S proteasome regulatory complex, subunit RPN8/PSMD7 [Guillardia theta CCMP2712]|uniref:26S proteasome regulatory complex, subunit RPN8/PSMD7 n=1 Tax=Guillardia theta (strain CCMP2712) TaxID=905079 RepID=L1J8X5_GUITC|nr:26S proteasome regulatory complex, subunit RPN8/PSMD7 [Guillardia theta CCMP2712]EKX44976.1 26S proteasome regulatory complex, subunit RPN8/PSMD7 [Guillardia theta CCMP2712]|eukprot:XP_005831956.1 26S proteasome regulatory complex, subunit RPN8/PSMD7 [Guillardia theta CCMP2712]